MEILSTNYICKVAEGMATSGSLGYLLTVTLVSQRIVGHTIKWT